MVFNALDNHSDRDNGWLIAKMTTRTVNSLNKLEINKSSHDVIKSCINSLLSFSLLKSNSPPFKPSCF